MARVKFESVFKKYEDGSIEPLQRIRIGGVTFGPGPGVVFRPGIAIAGVDLTQYVGHDLEVETDNGVLVITGIY